MSELESQIARFALIEVNDSNKYISKWNLPTCFIQTQIIKLPKYVEWEKFVQNLPIPGNN